MHGKDNCLDLSWEGRERSGVTVANDCFSHLQSAAPPRLCYSQKVGKCCGIYQMHSERRDGLALRRVPLLIWPGAELALEDPVHERFGLLAPGVLRGNLVGQNSADSQVLRRGGQTWGSRYP